MIGMHWDFALRFYRSLSVVHFATRSAEPDKKQGNAFDLGQKQEESLSFYANAEYERRGRDRSLARNTNIERMKMKWDV